MQRNNVDIPEKLWLSFRTFAEDFNIGLEFEEDWGDWWDCWISGYWYAKAEGTKKP